MNLRDLISSAPVLADGAWGTELQKCGLALDQCPDAWNLQRFPPYSTTLHLLRLLFSMLSGVGNM